MLGRTMGLNSLLLGLFAALTTVIIAGTYLGTRERIAESQRAAEQKALLEIVPDERNDNDLLDMLTHIREVTGKPVGFKAVIGAYGWLQDVCEEVLRRGPEGRQGLLRQGRRGPEGQLRRHRGQVRQVRHHLHGGRGQRPRAITAALDG